MGDPRHVLFGSGSPEPESSTFISPERARQISSLLFASKALADRICLTGTSSRFCFLCMRHEVCGDLKHGDGCEAGRVEAIIAELCAAPSRPIPIRKEDAEGDEKVRAEARTSPRIELDQASVDARERMAACVQFCEGIPTETLQHELPLASSDRRRWHEIMYLRRALPFLPAVTL